MSPLFPRGKGLIKVGPLLFQNVTIFLSHPPNLIGSLLVYQDWQGLYSITPGPGKGRPFIQLRVIAKLIW